MGMAMPEQGVCMYQIDLEGHGYSGGERAYIEDYNHWVDDYRQVRRWDAVVCGRDRREVHPQFVQAGAAHTVKRGIGANSGRYFENHQLLVCTITCVVISGHVVSVLSSLCPLCRIRRRDRMNRPAEKFFVP